jgi:hypothetical protein
MDATHWKQNRIITKSWRVFARRRAKLSAQTFALENEMRRSHVIVFLGGAASLLLGGLAEGLAGRWWTSIFTALFEDWFVSRGYTSAIYLFGSFWGTLPSALVAMIFGLIVGASLSGSGASLALAGSLGWLASFLSFALIGGAWWLTSAYGVVFAISCALALVLLSTGTLLGAHIRKRTSSCSPISNRANAV